MHVLEGDHLDYSGNITYSNLLVYLNFLTPHAGENQRKRRGDRWRMGLRNSRSQQRISIVIKKTSSLCP